MIGNGVLSLEHTYFDFSTKLNRYVVDADADAPIDIIEEEIGDYIVIDEGRIIRRSDDWGTKDILLSKTQEYLDFLGKIFAIVPNRGAPFENTGALQPLLYGYLYLNYLF